MQNYWFYSMWMLKAFYIIMLIKIIRALTMLLSYFEDDVLCGRSLDSVSVSSRGWLRVIHTAGFAWACERWTLKPGMTFARGVAGWRVSYSA